jgi:hypothetical protein
MSGVESEALPQTTGDDFSQNRRRGEEELDLETDDREDDACRLRMPPGVKRDECCKDDADDDVREGEEEKYPD